MLKVYPDYYDDFNCISSRCTHSCCIGWEIDIDKKTLSNYQMIKGDFGCRLKKSVKVKEVPHFKLKSNGRCPFLNDKNLCDIIINLGKDSLCQICADHPRFRNTFTDRVEVGLGLCCEEVCRIVLTKKDKSVLIYDGHRDDDKIFTMRNAVIDILQDRTLSIKQRVDKALSFCNNDSDYSVKNFIDLLLHLEVLDKKWKKNLKTLRKNINFLDEESVFSAIESEPIEQFLVYLVYRHLANAVDIIDFKNIMTFIALLYDLFINLLTLKLKISKTLSIDDAIEFARQISQEIEYSDNNVDSILTEIAFQSI